MCSHVTILLSLFRNQILIFLHEIMNYFNELFFLAELLFMIILKNMKLNLSTNTPFVYIKFSEMEQHRLLRKQSLQKNNSDVTVFENQRRNLLPPFDWGSK